ncbi:MAG: FAD binding domain-containing protein [Thermodesulfobacteriota bacterium]
MRPVRLPASLDELWPLMAAQPGAALMAGGTDLLVRMRRGLADPEAIIGLERVAELKTIARREGWLRLGACATHQELIDHPLVAEHAPLLRQALLGLGSPPIRHMGSLGGNIVTASPAGDSLPPLFALAAEVELAWAGGDRRLPVAEFVTGPGRSALRPGEIVAAVWLPPSPGWQVQRWRKVGLRRALAIAVCSLAATVRLEADGRVAEARLAWGSVAPCVVRPHAVEAMLVGHRLDEARLREAGRALQAHISPIDDLRASAAYRRQVAANLLLALLD